jgi:hypothetical protein
MAHSRSPDRRLWRPVTEGTAAVVWRLCLSLAGRVRLDRPSLLALQHRQLGDIGRDALRFVIGKDFGLAERKRRRGYTSPDFLAF